MSVQTPKVVAGDIILRDAISAGTRAFVDDPDQLDILFEGYDQEIIDDIKAYFARRTGDGKFPFTIGVNFPRQGISLPHIAIVLGNEREVEGQDMLQNFAGVDVDETETRYSEVFAVATDTTYNVMIFGNDPNLTVYLYLIVKAILILNTTPFTQKGLLNILIGGSDINLDEGKFPEFAYLRTLTFNCLTYFKVPVLESVVCVSEFIGGVNLDNTESAEINAESC